MNGLAAAALLLAASFASPTFSSVHEGSRQIYVIDLSYDRDVK